MDKKVQTTLAEILDTVRGSSDLVCDIQKTLTLSSRDVFTTTGLIQLRICTSIHTYLSVNIV